MREENIFKVVDGDDWLNTEELPAFVELLAQVDTDVVAADFFVCSGWNRADFK